MDNINNKQTRLSVTQAKDLMTAIRADDVALCDAAASYLSMFPSYDLRYLTCEFLTLILKEKELLTPSQRLIAFTILHQTFSSQGPSSNPYIRFLVEASLDESAEKYERAFVLQLIGFQKLENADDVLLLPATDYMKGFDDSSFVSPQRQQLQQTYNIQGEGEEREGSSSARIRLKNVIPDPDIPFGCDAKSSEFDAQPGMKPKLGSGSKDDFVDDFAKHLSLKGFGPRWLTPFPPRLPVSSSELEWLTPSFGHELLWDEGMCAERETFRKLMAKALRRELGDAQQRVVSMLSKDFSLVSDCGLRPEDLPALVEKNPLIAAGVVNNLVDSSMFPEYFQTLVNMEVDKKSMEVVLSLATSLKLRPDYLLIYINKCLSYCNIEDKGMQKIRVVNVRFFLGELARCNLNNAVYVLSQLEAYLLNFLDTLD